MTNTTNNGGALPPTPAGVAGIAAAGDQTTEAVMDDNDKTKQKFLAVTLRQNEQFVLTDSNGAELAIIVLNAKTHSKVGLCISAPDEINVARRKVQA